MSVEAIVGAALTIGAALIGLAVAWGRQGARVLQLEKESTRFEALQTKVTEIDSKVETARKDQGYRLGNLESDTAVLKGKFEVFDRVFDAGQYAGPRPRKPTRSHEPGATDRKIPP